MSKSTRTRRDDVSRTEARDRFLDGVARRITEHRRLLGLTQGELAAAADLSLDAVNKIEVGTRFPNLSTLFDIATALKIGVEDLVAQERSRSDDVEQLSGFLEHQPTHVIRAVATCARAVVGVAEQSRA